jgi:hypothetical protein
MKLSLVLIKRGKTRKNKKMEHFLTIRAGLTTQAIHVNILY